MEDDLNSLASKYDKIAHQYRNVSENIYAPTRAIFLRQLSKYLSDVDCCKQVLDLGCGDGEILKSVYENLAHPNCTGVDISKRMLRMACKKMHMTPILSDIAHIPEVLPQHFYDLIIAHFVTSYVGLNKLFEVSKNLLSENGYLSLATNTMQSFKNIRNIANQSSNGFINYLLKKKVNNGIKHSKIPADAMNIEKSIESFTWRIINKFQLKIDLNFATPKYLVDYIFDGSWGISEVNSVLPLRLSKSLYQLGISTLCKFPFYDTALIEIYLIRH